MIKQGRLTAHDVNAVNRREVFAIRFPRRWIKTRRATAAIAAAEIVRADDEVAIRIQGLPRTDEEIPPAILDIIGPATIQTWDFLCVSGGMLAAR
jgi:hypothetical protein